MSPAADTPGPAAPAHARWRLRLLGDFALDDGRQTLHRLPSRAATALLARLAIAPHRAQAREELIELLWPGVGLAVGRNRLRQVLSTLKSLLEPRGGGDAPVLQADRLTLRLTPGALSCDVPAFEAALQGHHVDEARRWYRGELLPGFYDDWIVQERHRLAALADRLDALPARPPGAPPAARAPGTLAPAASNAPAARAPKPPLPHYLTPLHGADDVGTRLCAEVRRHRLVTLLGPGGQGKTRLAVEAAHVLGESGGWAAASTPERFDMVAFVPLVACTARETLFDALLLALRQPPRELDVLAQLGALFSGRRTLLVLDNFEQLVEDGAPVVAALLAANPQLHLLVTSRRVLGVDGEHAFVLPPLPLPAPEAGDEAAGNPAVALFVDRARAARADFHLSRRNRGAVIQLVRQLEGMPLAIELAAARVRSLPPAELLRLLQAAAAAPGNALALLARSGPRGGQDPRHASMLAVVQWSWQLLSAPARALLAQLSVFAGGCTLGAAQAVCAPAEAEAGAIALALDELVMQSMLRCDAEAGRYEPFEPIRLFATETLAPAEALRLRARHRQWLIGWARALPLAAPLHAVRVELANIGAAFASAEADKAPADAAALADALQGPLADISLPLGALRALARCAEALDDPTQRALTNAFLARALFRAGDPQAAAPLAEAAWRELPPQGLARARVLARLAHLRWRLQRDPAVQAWLDEALALAEAAGDPSLQASILATLGALARPHDSAAAISLQRRSLAAWRQAGDVHGMNTGRSNLAIALSETRSGGDEALALLDEMLAGTREAGDWAQHAHGSNVRGEVLLRQRRWAEAAAAYLGCVRTAYALPEMLPLAYGLWNLPRVLVRLGQAEAAARLMGFAEQFAPRHCGPLSHADRHDLRRMRRLCQRALGAAGCSRAWQAGAALPLAAAVGLAGEAVAPAADPA
ncbi:MAG: hypothetical protein HY855_22740 [Burkholderiales bacterium]|nr:hypothetical protein [Burkholderiales bacterium]